MNHNSMCILVSDDQADVYLFPTLCFRLYVSGYIFIPFRLYVSDDQ